MLRTLSIAVCLLAARSADAQISSTNPSFPSIDFGSIFEISEPSQQSDSVSYLNLEISGDGPAYGVSFSRMQAFTTASEFHSMFRSKRKGDQDTKDELKKLNANLNEDQLNKAADVIGAIEDRRVTLQDEIFRARNDDAEVLRAGNELLNLELVRMRLRLGLNNAGNNIETNRAIRNGEDQLKNMTSIHD